MNRAGHSILLSAISYTGTCILIPMAYVAQLGHELSPYREKDTRRIMMLSTLSYGLCCILLGLNYLGNIADHLIGGAGIVFSVIIMLAIYSTMCPILWTCASMLWSNEKSLPYRAFIVACGVVVYFVVLFIPFRQPDPAAHYEGEGDQDTGDRRRIRLPGRWRAAGGV